MSILNRVVRQFSPQRLGYRYRQLRNMLVDSRTLWQAGISEEIDFWRSAMTDPAEPNYQIVRDRFDPQRPLAPRLVALLSTPPGGVARLLDIGSGPVTVMGYQWEGRTVEITMIDALADEYNRLIDEVGLKPPVRAIQCHAEDIAKRFPAEHFDLIHSYNALDHAYNPMDALRQAMVLLKPGGWISLRHKVNEGKRIYNGLHQWNFCEENGEFVIWNMQKRYIVRDELKPLAQITTHVQIQPGLDPMIDANIQKAVL